MKPTDPANALSDAHRAMDGLRPLFETIYGRDAIERVERLSEDVELFRSAPKTYDAHLQDLLAGPANAFPREQLAPSLVSAVKAAARIEVLHAESQAEALGHPAGKVLQAYLLTARTRLRPSEVDTLLEPIRSLTPAAITKAGTHPTLDGAPPRFEAHATEIVDHLAHIAEHWYRPMLAVVLRITRLLRGRPAPAPTTLGNTMRQCQDLWSRPGDPRAVLHDEIRVIRNARSHTGMLFDVRAETITFEDHHSDGSVADTVGPWTRGQLADFTSQFLRTCIAMNAVLHAAPAGPSVPSSRRERREEARRARKAGHTPPVASTPASTSLTPPDVPMRYRAILNALQLQDEVIDHMELAGEHLQKATDDGNTAEAVRLMAELLGLMEQGAIHGERFGAAMRELQAQRDLRLKKLKDIGQKAEHLLR